MRRTALLVPTFSLLSLFSLSCIESKATPATFQQGVTVPVGPEGNTIQVDGATVTIPKGALSTTVSITITSSDDGAPAGFTAISKIFKCEPSGTSFAVPVTMTMPFKDDGLPSTMFWSTGADPTFKDLGGTPTNGTMTATVMHFSSGFVGRRN
jgi:hypothetical protein